MKHTKHFLLSFLIFLSATGCMKEEIDDPITKIPVMEDLEFNVNFSYYLLTKSDYVGDMELRSEDGKTINVSMSMTDCIESVQDETAQTRGAAIDRSNFSTYVSNIAVLGYLHGTSDAYVSTGSGAEALSKISEQKTSDLYFTHWAPTNTYRWPKGFTLDFWAWAPKATIDAALSNGTEGVRITNFSVNNHPSSGDPNISFHYDLGTGTDAIDQPDLMFTTSQDISQTQGTVNNGCVPLNLMHALSAIKFKLVSNRNAKIHEIRLVDVVKEADCMFTSSPDPTFCWTYNTAKPSSLATYGHSFEAELTADEPSDLYSSEPTANFMMIPQILGHQAISITMSLDEDSAPYTFTGTIPISNVTRWTSGKTYIYTIYIDKDVNVNITDQVENGVKKNVKMTNTGSLNAYLRAAITASWVDKKGKIISAMWTPGSGTWTIKNPGSDTPITASMPGGANTGWILGADGYYYYRNQVPPESDPTGALFDTYTPGECPNAGVDKEIAHLEMKVMVQAIEAHKLIDANGKTLKTGAAAYGWQTNLLTTNVDARSDR